MSDKNKRPPLHPEVEAYWERLKDKPLDAPTVTSMRGDASPIIGKVLMHGLNKKKLVTSDERKEVCRLYKEMLAEFPSKTRCYAAIAAKLNIKDRRVRYIIEGRRSSK